jgi:CRISPR-associated protein Csd1
MLERLVEYARSHGLTAEPGFAPKTVRWAIVCDRSGRLLEVTDLADADEPKGRTFPKCPELSQPEIKRGGSGCRHFLVDSADVVALLVDDPEDAKGLAKHAYFTGLLRQASEVMPELAAAAAVLEDPASLEAIREQLRARKAKPTDRMTFAIPGLDPLFPVQSAAWHDWWRRFRRSLAREEKAGAREPGTASRVRCLASGELVEPAPVHPKIAGLSNVGGLAMGDSLASFKQESFCSYGLVQSANAPVSEEIASAYRAALNDLIQEHSRRLVHAKVVHWFKDQVRPEDDLFAWFDESPTAQEASAQRRARELLDAIRSGRRKDLLGNRYYALTLSGAAGRVMVRDWMEGSFEELVRNLDAWFGDLSIVRRDGAGLAAPPKLLAVLGALARDLEELPPALETRLWRAALRREPIPFQARDLALARFKIDVLQDNPFKHARVGLLKAFHVREGDPHMQPHLNEDHPDPAYHCGRLMAMLAAVQYRALGDVGAGLVQRYYAAASTTPALVLGRLTRTSQFHLDKLDRGLARWHEGRIADTWGQIKDAVPPTLTLEEQSLFALGYYQQIAHDRTRTRPAAADGETPEPTADTQEADHE